MQTTAARVPADGQAAVLRGENAALRRAAPRGVIEERGAFEARQARVVAVELLALVVVGVGRRAGPRHLVDEAKLVARGWCAPTWHQGGGAGALRRAMPGLRRVLRQPLKRQSPLGAAEIGACAETAELVEDGVSAGNGETCSRGCAGPACFCRVETEKSARDRVSVERGATSLGSL